MKVLIISHNPISTYQSMGKTFLSLFSEFPKTSLCHLYIYPTKPDVDLCSSCYRITDMDVLKSFLKFGMVRGREVKSKDISINKHPFYDNEKEAVLYRNKKNKKKIRMLERDLMWKCSHWYNNRLIEWLKKEQPTHIFVAPGDAKFLYDIALIIAKKFNLQIVSYICDEFYFVKKPQNLIDRYCLLLLRRKIEQLMHKTSLIITICDELKKSYSEHFSIPATTIMTGTNYEIENEIKYKGELNNISYFGNISLNRHVVLSDIGKVLDKINSDKGTRHNLLIYTKSIDDSAKQMFKTIESIKLCDFVLGKEFDDKFHSADLLLHVESFDDESIDRVKHSISTKIADCLGSGICLLAYGPECIASIAYLKKNECAYVISNPRQLFDRLIYLLENNDIKYDLASCGLKVARDNHNKSKNSIKLYQIFNIMKTKQEDVR